LSEMTVNKLMDTAHNQLNTMNSLKVVNSWIKCWCYIYSFQAMEARARSPYNQEFVCNFQGNSFSAIVELED
jgi:hypothetical protein